MCKRSLLEYKINLSEARQISFELRIISIFKSLLFYPFWVRIKGTVTKVEQS